LGRPAASPQEEKTFSMFKHFGGSLLFTLIGLAVGG
jgi:hypothetical protein